jgi:hypothetical protein
MAASATETRGDDRILGIDRRTILPSLLVLGFAVLLSIILPSIDSTTKYHDQIHKGDVAAVAQGITIVPTPGWALASGALVGHTRSPVGSTATTQLVSGAVNFYVQAAPFAGTPSQLLTRVNSISAHLHHARGKAAGTSGRYRVTTRQRAVGVAEDFNNATRQGSVVAFVFKTRPSLRSQGVPSREGVEVVVSGPTASIARRRDDIVAMIRSIRSAR